MELLIKVELGADGKALWYIEYLFTHLNPFLVIFGMYLKNVFYDFTKSCVL